MSDRRGQPSASPPEDLEHGRRGVQRQRAVGQQAEEPAPDETGRGQDERRVPSPADEQVPAGEKEGKRERYEEKVDPCQACLAPLLAREGSRVRSFRFMRVACRNRAALSRP